MGRCGGLKEGGHHRKAIDLAAKKRAEKDARKKAQLNSSERVLAMHKILSFENGDVDVYLDAPNLRPMCRSYFRFDRCFNRRCKFSHKYSIAEAIFQSDAAMSTQSAKSKGKRDYDEDPSMPAVELIPGILGASWHRQRSFAMAAPKSGAAGAFEKMSDVIIRDIVAFCKRDSDVGHTAQSCRYLRQCLLDCKYVQRRYIQSMEIRLRTRNEMLMKKSMAGRLRFAVSYARVANINRAGRLDLCPDEGKLSNKKGFGSQKRRCKRLIRPTLVYDYECPNVFQAFQMISENKDYSLPSIFADSCVV